MPPSQIAITIQQPSPVTPKETPHEQPAHRRPGTYGIPVFALIKAFPLIGGLTLLGLEVVSDRLVCFVVNMRHYIAWYLRKHHIRGLSKSLIGT